MVVEKILFNPATAVQLPDKFLFKSCAGGHPSRDLFPVVVVLLQNHKKLGPRHVGVKHQVPRSVPRQEPVVSGPLDSRSLPVRRGVIRDRILGPLILGHHLIELLLRHVVLVSFQLPGYVCPEAVHIFPELGEPVHYVSVVGRHARLYPSEWQISCRSLARNIGQSCSYTIAAEQKARLTYDNILRLSDDPDVNNVIRFLREREIVHFQRFGECLRLCKEKMDAKNVYLTNPAFDKQTAVQPQPRNMAHG